MKSVWYTCNYVEVSIAVMWKCLCLNVEVDTLSEAWDENLEKLLFVAYHSGTII